MTTKIVTLIMVLVLGTAMCRAQIVPARRNTCIEVEFESAHAQDIERFHTLELTVRDIYTNEEQVVKGSRVGDGAYSLSFKLYHPLYSVITEHGHSYPFYVAPGDYLVIKVHNSGTLSYRKGDGGRAKYENLLKHDISQRIFYDSWQFEADKQGCRFPQFVEKMMHRLDSVLTMVDSVAAVHEFNDEEHRLARCNVQMQFAMWVYEFAPTRTGEISSYGRRNACGWQARDDQDNEIAAIEDARNYAFMRRMPLNDSLSITSSFFPMFIQNYQHTHFLNCDQYLYYGETAADHCRMDSAFIAKEMSFLNQDTPSVFMNIALARRELKRIGGIAALETAHSVPATADTIKTIELQGVDVVSLDRFHSVFGVWNQTPEDFVRKSWAHDVNLRGVISSLINHKKIKNYKRAKKVIAQLSKDDEEREALMRAYEQEMKRKKKR